MKIGLISDTHGSATMFQKVLEGLFKDVEMILHAGDIFYHGVKNLLPSGYNTNSLADMLRSLPVPLLIAKGNCDSDVDQMVLDVPIQSPYVFISVEGRRILLLHGDGKGEDDFAGLVHKFNLSLLVHGHSHIPRIKKVEGALIVNPGTPSLPGAMGPRKRTAGVFDTVTGRVFVQDIESGDIILEETL